MMRFKSLALLLLGGCFIQGVAWARTNDMKAPCSNCHTMHNSQIDSPMTYGGLSQQGALLRNSCYGCHSDAVSYNDKPVVWHISAPDYFATGTETGHDNLAGGDFFWVTEAGGDLRGHNVAGVVASQATRTPPGGSKSFGPSTPLACAGINGCHGDLSITNDTLSMYQSHHAVESAQPMDGSTLANSFRFLNGIAGYEDLDHELTVSSSDHNQYKGVARSADTDGDKTTISYSCAICHGDFHFGAADAGTWNGSSFGTDPWIRHPVDYDMGGLTPSPNEYESYGGSGTYNVATPLGSTVVTSIKSTVTLTSAAGDAIIVCVSCHRAHGSPYDYILRWDYLNWPSSGYNGCGDCHTAKN